MALKDIVSEVKKSKLYKAIANLDQDKQMGGFQLAKGGLGNQVQQGYQNAGKVVNALPTLAKVGVTRQYGNATAGSVAGYMTRGLISNVPDIYKSMTRPMGVFSADDPITTYRNASNPQYVQSQLNNTGLPDMGIGTYKMMSAIPNRFSQDQQTRDIAEKQFVSGEVQNLQGLGKLGLGLVGARMPGARNALIMGGALGGGFNALSGKSFSEGVLPGATQGLQSNAVVGLTNPLIRKLLPEGGGVVKDRILPMVANVIQGRGVDVALGTNPLDPLSIAIDVATGLLGKGQFAPAEEKEIKDFIKKAVNAKESGAIDFSAKVGGSDPLEALKTEARKYKSAEEFVQRMEKGRAKWGTSTVRINPVQNAIDHSPYVGKPGKKVEIFRVTPGNIEAGDFVFTSKVDAEKYMARQKDITPGTIKSMIVDSSEIAPAFDMNTQINNRYIGTNKYKNIKPGFSSVESIYVPKEVQGKSLTDLYTQATAPKGKITKVTTTKPQDFTFNVDGGKQRVQLVDTPQGKRLQIADTKLNVPLTSKQAVQVDSLINNSQAGQGLSRTSQKAIQPQTVDPQNGFSSQISDSTLNPGKITKAFQQQQGKTSQSVAQASKKADSPIQQLEDLRNIKGQQVRAKQVDLPSVDDIVRSQSNGVKNKVNALDYLRTPDKVLKKIGLGNEAELIKTQYGKYLDELPKEIDKVTSWYERVGKNEKASRRIFKYLDGQNQKLSGEELVVATEMKGYLKDWADRLGLPEDQRIANYITHIFEKDFIQKEFDPELAKIISDKVPGSVYDPFLQQRLGKLGYKEDAFSALDAYVKRATRKANMDVALEKLDSASSKLDLESWKYVKSYADRINLRPMDIDNLIDNAVKSSPIGYKLGQRPTASVSRGLRQMVYRGTLGLNVGSAIRNLTQGVNTYAKLGEKYTGIGYMKALRALASQSDELTQSGVMRNGFIEDRNLSATKKFWEKLDKGLFFMFEGAEKINRGSAYFGAKQKALDKGLSEAEAIKAGIEMARKTQFTFGSVDTPVALQSDLIKLATQFQSFNVKQTEFLAEMAKNKEYAGMLRWLGANMVVLATVGQAMGWDWKDMIPFGNVLDGQSPIGSSPVFQFGKDAATLATGGNDRYGNPMKPIQLANNAIPFVPGGVQLLNKTVPGLNDVNKGYATSGYGAEKLLDMATGNDRRVKFPIAQTPQNYITAGLLGTSKLPEARQYKNNEVSVLGEKQSETFRNLSQGDRAGYYEKILAKRDKNDTTSTTQDTQTTTTLPSDPESLKILYKDAESTIKGYRANKVKSEAGLVEKDVEDYQAEVDKAIQLKKQIEQQYPDFRKDTKGIYTYEDTEGAEKTIDISKVTKMPSTSKVQQIQKKQETYSMVTTIMKSDLSEEKKQQAITELGVSKKDADYYLLANEDNDVKIANAYDVMEKSQNFDDFMKYLVNGRRPVNGKILVTDGVINDLVDQGYLPESVGKELKDIDLYEDGTRNMGKIRARNAKSGKARAKKVEAIQRRDYEARVKAFNQFMNEMSKINTTKSSSSGSKISKVNVKNLTFSGR